MSQGFPLEVATGSQGEPGIPLAGSHEEPGGGRRKPGGARDSTSRKLGEPVNSLERNPDDDGKCAFRSGHSHISHSHVLETTAFRGVFC